MKNETFVCWECQIGNRHSTKCQICGRPMQKLIDKFRIPKKGNKGEWKKLKEIVINYNPFHKIGFEVYCKRMDWLQTYNLLKSKGISYESI